MRGNKTAGFLMTVTVAACALVTAQADYDQTSSFQVAQNNPPAVGSGEGSGMAQKPGKADEPKQYQPANPTPDPRVAPTGTTSGVGASSGGRPEQQPAAK